MFPVTLAMHAFIPNGVKEIIRTLTVEVTENSKDKKLSGFSKAIQDQETV